MAYLSKNADHVVVTDAVTRLAYNWLIYVYGLSNYLLIKNADLLPTDLYTLLKKCMFYLMGDVLTKIADLLVTNLSG